MGDVIDLNSRRKIEVTFDKEDPQDLLVLSIISLWVNYNGVSLNEVMEDDHESYLFVFATFMDICFNLMQKKEIVVSEDREIIVTRRAKGRLSEIIKSIKEELTTNNTTTH